MYDRGKNTLLSCCHMHTHNIRRCVSIEGIMYTGIPPFYGGPKDVDSAATDFLSPLRLARVRCPVGKSSEVRFQAMLYGRIGSMFNDYT